MTYHQIIQLKNGASCCLRSGTAADGQAALDNFILTHAETDNLLTYPEENTLTATQEGEYLQAKTESPNEVEILAIVDGKAKLIHDDYCDGLGDCLPTCPTGAITFVEREAAAYDEQAVMENKQRKMRKEGMTLPCGCPGSQSRNIQRQEAPAVETPQAQQTSRLSQWPVQIKLVPVNAPYFDGARLLIAADCTAYAYAAFHERFIKGHITLVGCPKLDSVDYSEKLTEIIRENDIKSVTVVRMEVPCCGGLELAAKKALQQSGKFIPWQVVTVTVDGRLVEE